MKKIIALLLAMMMVLGLCACGGGGEGNATNPPASNAPQGGGEGENPPATTSDMKVAMITDYGDITDQSFNQTTWEAVQQFGKDNSIETKYYKPTSNDTSGRVAQVELAIAEGYNVIVMPGYAFGGTLFECAAQYPEVKFIALDVAAGDILETAVPAKGETYSYNPDDYKLEDYMDMSNVYCAIYQEELCGYMAGFAAVKLGYTKLGFLGGMAVPAVMRYGYGYVQGASAAAQALGITVDMNYIYGGQFFGDADITAVMDTWYQGGTEIIFACGGGIYTSAVDAAKNVSGAKVIGVDVDQQAVIAAYAAGDGATEDQVNEYKSMIVTSAMKGLRPTTINTLVDVVINGNWSKYVGKIDTLGLVSGDDPSANYVQIAETTQFADGKFTADDYKALVKDLFDGKITVSNDTTIASPVDLGCSNININFQGNIKG